MMTLILAAVIFGALVGLMYLLKEPVKLLVGAFITAFVFYIFDLYIWGISSETFFIAFSLFFIPALYIINEEFDELKDRICYLSRSYRTYLENQENENKLLSTTVIELLKNYKSGLLLPDLLKEVKPNSVMEKYNEALDSLEVLIDEDPVITPLDDLREVQYELQTFSQFPTLFKNNTVAIGGGFSAGKSQFINSLLNEEAVKLSVDIKPTTAIPTYIVHNEKVCLLGCNEKGGLVNLSDIDGNIGDYFSHRSEAEFNFKTLMPYMVLTAPTNLKHLTFIDTPGYNPSSSENSTTGEDNETAAEFIQTAQALIWLIPVDAGTIPQTDLDFLEETLLENQPLYIVLSKADKRPQNAILEVMKNIQEELDDQGIDYLGISAYSASKAEELAYHKQSLKDFLASQNKPSKARVTALKEDFNTAKEAFNAMLLDKVNLNDSLLNAINELRIDLIDLGKDEKAENLITYFASEKETAAQKYESGTELVNILQKCFDYVLANSKETEIINNGVNTLNQSKKKLDEEMNKLSKFEAKIKEQLDNELKKLRKLSLL